MERRGTKFIETVYVRRGRKEINMGTKRNPKMKDIGPTPKGFVLVGKHETRDGEQGVVMKKVFYVTEAA